MLTTLNKIDLINLIYEQIDLFASFKKIYLFGSILHSNEDINDIDIFLLYIHFNKINIGENTCRYNCIKL